MADPVQHAEQDLARIDGRILKLQNQRERIAAFIEMYRHYAGEPPASVTGVIGRNGLSKKKVVADAVEAFIRVRGGHQRLAEIFSHLMQKAIEVGGKNPRQNLSAILYRDGRFTSDRSKGWTLPEFAPADTDETPSSYEPGASDHHDDAGGTVSSSDSNEGSGLLAALPGAGPADLGP